MKPRYQDYQAEDIPVAEKDGASGGCWAHHCLLSAAGRSRAALQMDIPNVCCLLCGGLQ